jgi:hypothetical protein
MNFCISKIEKKLLMPNQSVIIHTHCLIKKTMPKRFQMSLWKAIIGHWTSTYTSLEGHEGSPLVARVTKFF